MDKQVDALMWELVYTFITKHPKEAAETIANYVRKPEYLYLIEHEKDVKKNPMKPIDMQNKLDKRRKKNGKFNM